MDKKILSPFFDQYCNFNFNHDFEAIFPYTFWSV